MAAARTTVTFDAPAERLGERLLVRLPHDASKALPSRGQVAVLAEVNGRELATVVEPDGRRGHWLALDELALVLDDGAAPAGTADPSALDDGTPVSVRLTPVADWPEPQVPDDLAAALAEAVDLADTWRGITPMARWEWVRWVGATRNPATRARRVEVSVDKLRHGKRRPCCFDLSSCTDPELARSGKLPERA